MSSEFQNSLYFYCTPMGSEDMAKMRPASFYGAHCRRQVLTNTGWIIKIQVFEKNPDTSFENWYNLKVDFNTFPKIYNNPQANFFYPTDISSEVCIMSKLDSTAGSRIFI